MPRPLQQLRVVHPPNPRYVPVQLTADQRTALRVIGDEVLSTYGISPTGPRVPIARALRDFVARTSVHRHPPLHPNGSTANLTVLPSGKTWANLNTDFAARAAVTDAYWNGLTLNALTMFQRMYGTFSGATLADDGFMKRIGVGRWQMRDWTTYKDTLCTFQDLIFSVLAAAYGMYSTIVSTLGHDGCAVYIPGGWGDTQTGWMWCDQTYNECYRLDGVGPFLSPLELHYASLQGQAMMNRLISDHMAGPTHDPEPYIPHTRTTDSTYFNTSGNHPLGMAVTGTLLNVGTASSGAKLSQLPAAALNAAGPPFNDPVGRPRYPVHIVYPEFGLALTGWDETLTGVQFTFAASTAGASPYTLQKRFTPAGAAVGAWAAHAEWGDTVSNTPGLTEYRITDAAGLYGGVLQIKS